MLNYRSNVPSSSIDLHLVEVEQQRLIIWLLQSDQPGSFDLAIDLARQGPRSPWVSGASLRHQAYLHATMIEALDTVLGRGTPLTAISWFPNELAIPVGSLHKFNLDRFLATRRRALQRTFPDILAFGVVNVSLYIFSGGHTAWLPEVRLIMEAADTIAFRDRFWRRCRANEAAVRPLRTCAFTDTDRLAYLSGATDALPKLRTRMIDHDGQFIKSVRSLTGETAVEAALFLHRFPLCTRLILRCLRRLGGRSVFELCRSP